MTEAEWQARATSPRSTGSPTLRLDRHHQHPHVGAHSRRARLLPDQQYGDLFHEITASSLVKLDLDGTVYSEDGSFNAAGFTIHSGVYKARPDVNCVMHTHTRAGTGISVLKKGLRPISQDALAVLDDRLSRVRHADIAGGMRCAGRELPAGKLRRAAQSRAAVGRREIPAALRRLYMMERACEVEIIARGLDEEPAPIEDDVIQSYAARAKAQRASPEFGMTDWKAALRQIEGKGIDWRQ